MTTPDLVLEVDDLSRPEVLALLREHLDDMYATTPAESVHALDVEELRAPGVTFWTAWSDGELVGCAALKEVEPGHGEVKTMRTTAEARGRGVARRVLAHLVEEARRRGWERLSLETGVEDYFAPARRLYASAGFVECAPFAGYRPDPLSVFMTLDLRA